MLSEFIEHQTEIGSLHPSSYCMNLRAFTGVCVVAALDILRVLCLHLAPVLSSPGELLSIFGSLGCKGVGSWGFRVLHCIPCSARVLGLGPGFCVAPGSVSLAETDGGFWEGMFAH